MSKTMTTKPGQIAAGDVPYGEKEVHPLSDYWKALVPIVVGSGVAAAPGPGRSQAECMVLLRPIRRGDYSFDS